MVKSEFVKVVVFVVVSDNDDIIDEEFEVLFDDLYGKGKFGGEEVVLMVNVLVLVLVMLSVVGDEEIIDDEFEVLFD